jgi:hypothetical protein
MSVWISVLLLVAFAGAGAALADSLLRPSEKLRIHALIIRVSESINAPDPRVVIQTPLFLAIRLLQRLYGKDLFSLVAFRRASFFGGCLLGFALVLSGLRWGAPFSLDDLPWRTFDRTFAAVETLAVNTANDKGLKPDVRALEQRVLTRVRKYKNPENRLMYSVLFFPLIAIAAALLNFLSISFARRALEEMALARNLISLFSLMLSTLFVSPLIYLMGISILCIIATPFSWLVVWALIACGHYVSWLLALGLALPSVIVALFFSAQWIKVLVSVIMLPSLLAIILSIGALVLFPFRGAIRWLLVEFFDRAVSSDKGFLACCALFFAVLGSLAVELTKALGGKLPF